MATVNLKLIGFNDIVLLQTQTICVLTKASLYHKHLSTSLFAVGDLIIWKSLHKLAKKINIKVATKQWRDGSQTQWHGGVYMREAEYINTFRPRQIAFPDDIFKRIFVNENIRISIKIYVKCVPNGPIDNIQALSQ